VSADSGVAAGALLIRVGRIFVVVRTGESAIAAWDIPVGATLSRGERMRRFGGSKYGGIQPSGTTPNTFVYSDPAKGLVHGYAYDGWSKDRSIFFYTGEGHIADSEGRIEDQLMVRGNRALAEHRAKGHSLRVFVADGQVAGRSEKIQRYIGEFAVDSTEPYDVEDDTANDRTVLVFRLRPIGKVLHRAGDVSPYEDADQLATASLVEVEINRTTAFALPPSRPKTAVRREGELTDRYMASVGPGRRFRRWKLTPAGQRRPLLTDIYDETENVLYEAKSTSTREAVREAIGQLLDYRRVVEQFVERDLRLVVLLPHRPAEDLVAFIHSVGMDLVIERPIGGFEWIESLGRPPLAATLEPAFV
jgi:SAD/SRA domain-containing protein